MESPKGVTSIEHLVQAESTEARIFRRGLNVYVTEQLLNRRKVRTMLVEVRGEGATYHVSVSTWQSCSIAHLSNNLSDRHGSQGPIFRRPTWRNTLHHFGQCFLRIRARHFPNRAQVLGLMFSVLPPLSVPGAMSHRYAAACPSVFVLKNVSRVPRSNVIAEGLDRSVRKQYDSSFSVFSGHPCSSFPKINVPNAKGQDFAETAPGPIKEFDKRLFAQTLSSADQPDNFRFAQMLWCFGRRLSYRDQARGHIRNQPA